MSRPPRTRPEPKPARPRKAGRRRGPVLAMPAAPAPLKRPPAPAPAKARKPSKAEKRRDAARARKADRATAAPVGRLDALGFFMLAGLIVADAARRPRPAGSGGAGRAAAAEAQEPGRGRAAASPQDIPVSGWRDVLSRTWSEFNNDHIMSVAAGVTFFALLALFPAIGAFVSLYGLFADVKQAEGQLRLLRGVLPKEVIDFVGGEILRIAAGRSGGLGVAFAVSLLISLWSANGAVKAMFGGLNIAYEERETRNFLRLNLISFAFTLGALLFVAVTLSAVVAVPVALHFIGLDSGSVWLAELRWPLLLVVAAFAISVLYRYGPSRRKPRWRWISWGGTLAAVLWLAASVLFSFYVANFAHYDKTYGSLGAVVGFMTWIWYSTIIVLLGAELNSELEHQTTVDTTAGDPRHTGARGAAVADTLGPAVVRRAAAAAHLGALFGN